MPPTPDPAYVASLEATSEGGNTFKTTFRGPASGITDDVWFWTPRGYSATDGKSYNVLTLLHGVPGTADGLVSALELGPQLQAAIDDGRLPPTIIAVPSLNPDAAQRSEPDCADIVGHAKVGTWIQEDVPRMIRATFPGTRADREAWALVGVSSGGYCAVWTTIMRSDVYATAGSLSGYDVPGIGGLASPELRESNTLSTLVARQTRAPLRARAPAPIAGSGPAAARSPPCRPPSGTGTPSRRSGRPRADTPGACGRTRSPPSSPGGRSVRTSTRTPPRSPPRPRPRHRRRRPNRPSPRLGCQPPLRVPRRRRLNPPPPLRRRQPLPRSMYVIYATQSQYVRGLWKRLGMGDKLSSAFPATSR